MQRGWADFAALDYAGFAERGGADFAALVYADLALQAMWALRSPADFAALVYATWVRAAKDGQKPSKPLPCRHHRFAGRGLMRYV